MAETEHEEFVRLQEEAGAAPFNAPDWTAAPEVSSAPSWADAPEVTRVSEPEAPAAPPPTPPDPTVTGALGTHQPAGGNDPEIGWGQRAAEVATANVFAPGLGTVAALARWGLQSAGVDVDAIPEAIPRAIEMAMSNDSADLSDILATAIPTRTTGEGIENVTPVTDEELGRLGGEGGGSGELERGVRAVVDPFDLAGESPAGAVPSDVRAYGPAAGAGVIGRHAEGVVNRVTGQHHAQARNARQANEVREQAPMATGLGEGVALGPATAAFGSLMAPLLPEAGAARVFGEMGVAGLEGLGLGTSGTMAESEATTGTGTVEDMAWRVPLEATIGAAIPGISGVLGATGRAARGYVPRAQRRVAQYDMAAGGLGDARARGQIGHRDEVVGSRDILREEEVLPTGPSSMLGSAEDVADQAPLALDRIKGRLDAMREGAERAAGRHRADTVVDELPVGGNLTQMDQAPMGLEGGPTSLDLRPMGLEGGPTDVGPGPYRTPQGIRGEIAPARGTQLPPWMRTAGEPPAGLAGPPGGDPRPPGIAPAPPGAVGPAGPHRPPGIGRRAAAERRPRVGPADVEGPLGPPALPVRTHPPPVRVGTPDPIDTSIDSVIQHNPAIDGRPVGRGRAAVPVGDVPVTPRDRPQGLEDDLTQALPDEQSWLNDLRRSEARAGRVAADEAGLMQGAAGAEGGVRPQPPRERELERMLAEVRRGSMGAAPGGPPSPQGPPPGAGETNAAGPYALRGGRDTRAYVPGTAQGGDTAAVDAFEGLADTQTEPVEQMGLMAADTPAMSPTESAAARASGRAGGEARRMSPAAAHGAETPPQGSMPAEGSTVEMDQGAMAERAFEQQGAMPPGHGTETPGRVDGAPGGPRQDSATSGAGEEAVFGSTLAEETVAPGRVDMRSLYDNIREIIDDVFGDGLNQEGRRQSQQLDDILGRYILEDYDSIPAAERGWRLQEVLEGGEGGYLERPLESIEALRVQLRDMPVWSRDTPLNVRDASRRRLYGAVAEAMRGAHESASAGGGEAYRALMRRHHVVQSAGQAAERATGRAGARNPIQYTPGVAVGQAFGGPAGGAAVWGARQILATHGHAFSATAWRGIIRSLNGLGHVGRGWADSLGRALDQGVAAAAAAHWAMLQNDIGYRDWHAEQLGDQE